MIKIKKLSEMSKLEIIRVSNQLEAINEDCYYEGETTSVEFIELSESEYNEVYVSYFNNKICGYLVIGIPDSNEIHVDDVAIHSDYRGNKISNELISFVEEDYSDVKAIEIFTSEIETDNIASIVLHLKMGFIPNGLIANYYSQGRNALYLTKQLKWYMEVCYGSVWSS